MIKVLLIDDHILVRLGLRGTIDAEDDMTLVGQASNSLNIVELYESLEPDVVVMDFRMQDDNGIKGTKRLLKHFPDARVLMLSVYEGEEDIWLTVKAGALGYVTKGDDTQELLTGIRAIANGCQYFPEKIAQKLKNRKQRIPLTQRETETLTLLVQGLSNKELSDEMGISIGTAKLHIANVLIKLEVRDRTQAAIVAVHRGIVHLDD